MKAPPDWLYRVVPLLACVGGSVDAAAYMTLGKVFPANMTGNTVLLAIAMATGDVASIERTGFVLLIFCVGVCVGARYLHGTAPGWHRHVTSMFALEGLLLTGVATCVLVRGAQPPSSLAVLALGGGTALAMGLQSALVRHLRISRVRTTFVTGPLVEAVAGCFDRASSRGVREPPRGLLAWTYLAYLLAAAAAALLSRFLPGLAMFLPPFALTAMLLYRIGVRRRGARPARRG